MTTGLRTSVGCVESNRQAIARAIADKSRTIRIPVHVVVRLNSIRRAERSLTTALGREPTPEEIAEVTGIDPDEVTLWTSSRPGRAHIQRHPRAHPPNRKPGDV